MKFFEFEREFLNLSSRNFQGEVQGEVSGGALRGSFQGEVLSFVYWAMNFSVYGKNLCQKEKKNTDCN